MNINGIEELFKSNFFFFFFKKNLNQLFYVFPTFFSVMSINSRSLFIISLISSLVSFFFLFFYQLFFFFFLRFFLFLISYIILHELTDRMNFTAIVVSIILVLFIKSTFFIVLSIFFIGYSIFLCNTYTISYIIRTLTKK
jgi:hypothetical protein